jgi:hypothetical protein
MIELARRRAIRLVARCGANAFSKKPAGVFGQKYFKYNKL